MTYEFKFPDVGQGITEGEVVKWLVKLGDTVKEDQVLAEIETDKAVVEAPSPKAGIIIMRHKSNEGEKINVGDVIVVIGKKGEKYVPGQQTKSIAIAKDIKRDTAAVVGSLPSSAKDLTTGIFVMPAVRKLATELKVDISKLKGTGPNGRITEDDVKKIGGQSTSPSKPQGIKVTKKYDFWGMVKREPFKGVRKLTADKMSEAARKAPLVTNMDEADVTDLEEIRKVGKKEAAKKNIKLTLMPFLIMIVVDKLRKPEFKYVNSSLDEDAQEIIVKDYCNIGFAVATDAGLLVPVIKGVNMKKILDIAKEAQELAEKARNRKLDLADMQGGTFTISNIGSIGGTFFTPIINLPEAALLGVGKMIEKPVAKEGRVVIRKMLPLSLTYDHRLIDGAQAAAFLAAIKDALEHSDKF
jgi:pyruvate dehydrogenase E2 component (dihydrolipoamide acetyltransferase)